MAGRSVVRRAAALAALVACLGGPALGALFEGGEELGPLKLDKPGSNGWRVLAKAAGPTHAVLYPGERVSVELAVRNEGTEPLKGDVFLYAVRIGTRRARAVLLRPDAAAGGETSRVVALSEPVRLALPEIEIAPQKEGDIAWQPEQADAFAEPGVYAIVLEIRGKGQQAAATFVRALAPSPAAGDGKTSPLVFPLDPQLDLERQLNMARRLGYRWARADAMPNWASVSQADLAAPFEWTKADAWVQALRQRGLYLITGLHGSPRQAITDANWAAGNRVHDPKHDERFGDFVQEAVARYCGPEGDGPLQVIDFWTDPWEGGSDSGWKSDAARYRALYKLVHERAHKGSRRITVGGTSSIMNTFDKFFSVKGGKEEWGERLDVLTDHAVAPWACFGPRVGRNLITLSMETGQWPRASAESLVAVATHVLATGQRKVGPGRAAHFFWENGPAGPMCGPAAAAASFFLHFTAGMEFERVAFHDHLPWLYQWGGGQRVGFILAGDRRAVSPRAVGMYHQITADGTITIDAMEGRLKAFDLYGHPYRAENGLYRLPCSAESVYLEAPGLPAEMVVETVAAGRMDGVTPVEFFVDDFVVPVQQAKALEIEVHNVLNRQVLGTLTVLPPSSISLDETVISVTLSGGGSKTLRLPINWAKTHPANAYPFALRFESAMGRADWTEEVHVNTIAHGSPTVDGNLADWSEAIPLVLRTAEVEFNLAEAAWRPWETRSDVARGMAEVRFMWDDDHLYLAIRERDKGWKPKPRLSTRRDDDYFGTGDLAQTYVKPVWDALPYGGYCVQLGLRVLPLRARLQVRGVVPSRMVAADDTDYEYALWGAPDGGAEVWRNAAPDLGFFNFLPRCMPEGYDGVPKGAKAAVKRQGDDTVYEAAIPFADMAGFRPAPGKIIQMALAIPAAGLELGAGRSRPRSNSLTLRPTWAAHLSNEIRWGFIKQ